MFLGLSTVKEELSTQEATGAFSATITPTENLLFTSVSEEFTKITSATESQASEVLTETITFVDSTSESSDIETSSSSSLTEETTITGKRWECSYLSGFIH